MITDPLDSEEKQILLKLARQSIERVVRGLPSLQVELELYSQRLQALGVSFVTLTKEGDLRGCIGALEAYQPLVQDVCEHAAAAATEDYRFQRVQENELGLVEIEISRLTPPQVLAYTRPEELLEKLHPGVDGVILRDGMRRATFLPQVWEKIPDGAEFLTHLCQKMGAPWDLWRKKPLQVLVYQVEEFHEGQR